VLKLKRFRERMQTVPLSGKLSGGALKSATDGRVDTSQ
jgi:hypothetical protein